MTASRPRWRTALRALVALLALGAILVSVVRIEAPGWPLEVERIGVGETPVTVYRLPGAEPAPAVVVAHGFAGSRQLMEPIAVSLARHGYVAASFDFRGHGRNPVPLSGDVTAEDGATRVLQNELARVVDAARELPGADGRVAVLGHSMASDIIVREARADPDIAATLAISLFSREVTEEEPRNLFVAVGEWEAFLAEEGRRVVAMAEPGLAPGDVREGVTYGAHAEDTARRLVLADNAEHVAVLYSAETMGGSVAWLDAVFGRGGTVTPEALDTRGPWIALLLAGVVALAWPLSALLPRIGHHRVPPPASRRALLIACVGPAVATPLLLWPFEIGFLPVLVADYLSVHFVVYGALTLAALVWLRVPRPGLPERDLLVATAAASLFAVFAIGVPLDLYFASFMPSAGRLPVILALAAGALTWSLADEWLIRRPEAPRWLPFLSKLSFLLSLGVATALDLEDLFFLVIILPVIVIFFLLYSTMSSWAFRATGHPGVGGTAVGLAFGWALGVTFPLLAS